MLLLYWCTATLYLTWVGGVGGGMDRCLRGLVGEWLAGWVGRLARVVGSGGWGGGEVLLASVSSQRGARNVHPPSFRLALVS